MNKTLTQKYFNMNVQTQKKELIAAINTISDAYLLIRVKNFLKDIREETPSKSNDLLSIAYEPTPEFIDLKDLAKQQDYNGKRLAHRLENVNEAIWKGENISELMECLNS